MAERLRSTVMSSLAGLAREAISSAAQGIEHALHCSRGLGHTAMS